MRSYVDLCDLVADAQLRETLIDDSRAPVRVCIMCDGRVRTLLGGQEKAGESRQKEDERSVESRYGEVRDVPDEQAASLKAGGG